MAVAAPTNTAISDRPIAPWWLTLLSGIALVIIGVMLWTRPVATTLILAQVVGWYWFFSGILNIVNIFIDRRLWGWNLFMGIVGIVAGLWIVQNPIAGAVGLLVAIAIVLGVQGLIMGVASLMAGFQGGGIGSIVMGIVSVLLGILILSSIWVAALAVPWVYGIFAVAGGIAEIVAAFVQRGQQRAAV